jgi:Planctomycete cytochrome C
LLEYLNRKRNNLVLNQALNIVFLWGAIAAILSCVSGYLLSQAGGYEEDTLEWHKYLGISVAVISSVFYLFKKLGNLSWLSFLDKLAKPILAVLAILLLATGHLGGNMTHGSDYLTASLPQPFKGWLGIKSKEKAIVEHKITDSTKAIAYTDVIVPLLENKCYQCHSAEKQKGKLRLDSPEYMTKGGKDGVIFLAGNATSSEMIKRALLPENEEGHMPPKGKTQLTEDEIALLHWWIQSGASFTKKVNELPKTNKVQPILASLMAGASLAGMVAKSVPESPIYSLKVDKASDGDVKKLTDKNVLILPLSKETNLLEASCVNNKEFADVDAKLLENLSNQLVWLKLTNTKITDVSLASVAKLPNLLKLHLDHTAITDKGIDNLINLKNLEYLNLVGTIVSDASLAKIGRVKSLKKLFLWQTKMTKPAVEAFKKSHPNIAVDFGWEGPALVSDTSKVKVGDVKKEDDN